MELLKQLAAKVSASEGFSSVAEEENTENTEKARFMGRYEQVVDKIDESLVYLHFVLKDNSNFSRIVKSLNGDEAYIKDLFDHVTKMEEILQDLQLSVGVEKDNYTG